MKKILVLFLILSGQLVWGQVSISVGNTITENFNTIGTSATATLPDGWKADKNTSVRKVGTYLAAGTATEQRAGNSMSTTATNGIYNYAAGDPISATDRSVGGLSSSSGGNSVNVYLQLINNGVNEINNFTISYAVEKYRNGKNAAGFSIQMYHSTDGSTWTTAGNDFLTSFAADADNNGYTTAPGATVNVTNKTLTITISAGSSLYLAWNYSVTSGTTVSNAQALGIDDVSITANSALPVELNSFTAFAGKSGVELNWSTATEVNNYGFDILRQVIPQQVILRQAQDDNNWEKIGFVAGHGNSNSPKDYSFVDANPPAGKVLYKLKQIDFDGAFEYSKVVEVNVETPQEFRLAQNYPNPFNPSTVINYQLPMDGNVTLKVYDMLGKEVTTLVNEFQRAGSYNYQFSINNLQLSSGVYYYRLQSGNFVETKKFIVMK